MMTRRTDRVTCWPLLLRSGITTAPGVQPRHALRSAKSCGHFVPKTAIVPESGMVERLGSNVDEVSPDSTSSTGASAARWLKLSPNWCERTGMMARSHELRERINAHFREGRIVGPLCGPAAGLDGLRHRREGAQIQLRRGTLRRHGQPGAGREGATASRLASVVDHAISRRQSFRGGLAAWPLEADRKGSRPCGLRRPGSKAPAAILVRLDGCCKPESMSSTIRIPNRTRIKILRRSPSSRPHSTMAQCELPSQTLRRRHTAGA